MRRKLRKLLREERSNLIDHAEWLITHAEEDDDETIFGDLLDYLGGQVPVISDRLDEALEWEFIENPILHALAERYDSDFIEWFLWRCIDAARARVKVSEWFDDVGDKVGGAWGSLADLVRERIKRRDNDDDDDDDDDDGKRRRGLFMVRKHKLRRLEEGRRELPERIGILSIEEIEERIKE